MQQRGDQQDVQDFRLLINEPEGQINYRDFLQNESLKLRYIIFLRNVLSYHTPQCTHRLIG